MTTRVLEVFAKEDDTDSLYPVRISRNLSISDLEEIVATIQKEIHYLAMPIVKSDLSK